MSASPEHTWSLEKELVGMAPGVDSLDDALVMLGLVDASDTGPFTVSLSEEWRRGGAESYVTSFELSGASRSRTFFLKALVPYPGTMSVAEAVDRFVLRAGALNAVGIATPTTYAAVKGTLLQEYLSYSLAEALATAAASRRAELVFQALNLRSLLPTAGFYPLQFFSDLRSDGNRVLLVDLGDDLIARSCAQRDVSAAAVDCQRWLNTWFPGGALREELIDDVARWSLKQS